MWTYIKNRDTKGALEWIEYSMDECIHGEYKIYYE